MNPVLEKLQAAAQEVHELLLVPGRRCGAREVEQMAEAAGITVCEVTRPELDRLTRGGNHQGVAARVRPYRYATLDELLAPRPSRLLFLDQVTDPHNLGAIIRSAEAFGVGGLVLARDRAAAVTPVVARTAAGALEYVRVCQVVNLGRTLDLLRGRDYWVVGLDPIGHRAITELPVLERLAVVVGGEGRGLREGTRRRCDFLARIETVGRVGSLNAGIAAAVALFWFGSRARQALPR